ncbi:MAG: preprotein translocase subunit SecG [Planctomycetes bacterium]|nr:preprotein translocase subunit SecG [Planctomycetota bacterium]
MTLDLIQLASFVGILKGLVMVLFVLVSLLLILVVLVQEGKGGGIAGAFGGAAADTFGVKAGTVNRFTVILGSVFCGLALLHAGFSAAQAKGVMPDAPPAEAPSEPPAPSEPATPPAMTDAPPAMSDAPPAMSDTPPAMGDAPPAMTDAPPAMTDEPPAMTDAPPAMEGDGAPMGETPPPTPSMGG